MLHLFDIYNFILRICYWIWFISVSMTGFFWRCIYIECVIFYLKFKIFIINYWFLFFILRHFSLIFWIAWFYWSVIPLWLSPCYIYFFIYYCWYKIIFISNYNYGWCCKVYTLLSCFMSWSRWNSSYFCLIWSLVFWFCIFVLKFPNIFNFCSKCC
jgi:hypothetical protein